MRKGREDEEGTSTLAGRPLSTRDVVDAALSPWLNPHSQISQEQTLAAITSFVKQSKGMNLTRSPFSPARGTSDPASAAPQAQVTDVDWLPDDNLSPQSSLCRVLQSGRRVVVVIIPFLSKSRLSRHLSKAQCQVRSISGSAAKSQQDGRASKNAVTSATLPFFVRHSGQIFGMENVYVWKSTRTCPFLSTLMHIQVPGHHRMDRGTQPPRGGLHQTPLRPQSSRGDEEKSQSGVRPTPDKLADKSEAYDADSTTFDTLQHCIKRIRDKSEGILLNPFFLGAGGQEESGFLVPSNEEELQQIADHSHEDYCYLKRKSRRYGGKDDKILVLGPGLLHGWFAEKEIKCGGLTAKDCIAIDCEMLEVEGGIEALGRVAMTDGDGNVLLDEHVKPPAKVVNYKTAFSGLTAVDIAKAELSLEDVQMKLVELFVQRGRKLVLIGHSVDHDLTVLRMMYPFFLDSSLLYPHVRGGPMKCSLKMCSNMVLGVNMHLKSKGGHDPKEDALASWCLAVDKVTKLSQHLKPDRVSSMVYDDVPSWMTMSANLGYIIPAIVKKDGPASSFNDTDAAFPSLEDTSAPHYPPKPPPHLSTPTLPRFEGGWRAGVHVFDEWPLAVSKADHSCFFSSKLSIPSKLNPRTHRTDSSSVVKDCTDFLHGRKGLHCDHPFSCKCQNTEADEVLTARLNVVMLRDFQQLCCSTLGCLRDIRREGLPPWDAPGESLKGRHSGLFYGGGYNGRARRLLYTGHGKDVMTMDLVKSEQPVEALEGIIRDSGGAVVEDEECIKEMCQEWNTQKLFPTTTEGDELPVLMRIDSYLSKIYSSMNEGELLYITSGSGDAVRYFNLEAYRRCIDLSDFPAEYASERMHSLDKLMESAHIDFLEPFGALIQKD